MHSQGHGSNPATRGGTPGCYQQEIGPEVEVGLEPRYHDLGYGCLFTSTLHLYHFESSHEDYYLPGKSWPVP